MLKAQNMLLDHVAQLETSPRKIFFTNRSKLQHNGGQIIARQYGFCCCLCYSVWSQLIELNLISIFVVILVNSEVILDLNFSVLGLFLVTFSRFLFA